MSHWTDIEWFLCKSLKTPYKALMHYLICRYRQAWKTSQKPF